MREPKPNDLIDFVLRVQPELDRDAAAVMLIHPDVWDYIAQKWRDDRDLAQTLLEAHMERVA